MGRLTRFRRLGGRARARLIEAIVYLAAARLALRFFHFKRLTWLFGRAAKKPEVVGNARAQFRKEVRQAIGDAQRFLPGETACFPRAIAAQAMLRRRGVSTTLYYGAKTIPDRGLTAHAWVQDGAVGVVGYSDASDYHALARYPETR